MNRSSNPKQKRRTFLRRAALACVLGAQLLGAQTVARESDVEAAYLFNFGKFMRTPKPAGSEFKLCILGADPFGSKLAQLTSHESIDGRTMKIADIASPEEGRSCDILFIAEEYPSRMTRDLKQLNGNPVLTVSTAPGFTDHGGMIQFVMQQDHVRFRVNLDAVMQAHIQLSSELLKVAVSVTGGRGEAHP